MTTRSEKPDKRRENVCFSWKLGKTERKYWIRQF